MAEGLIPLLLEGQLANVHENLNALLEQNRDWVYIKLTWSTGLRIYPLDEPVIPDPVPETIRILHQPVGFMTPKLAELELAVDFGPELIAAKELERRLGSTLLLLLAAFVLVSGAVLEWAVLRRLHKLAVASDQMTNGDYEAFLPDHAGDKIGNLVKSFTSMRSAIQQYHKQLEGEIDTHEQAAEVLREEKELATYQAIHDPLTGLINRREFERLLHDAIQEAGQTSDQHGLLYMDLDKFKVVNDTCGHVAGDALLQQLNIVLQDQMRQHDYLARLGGDEFGVLLKYCDQDNAVRVAENLRQAIQEFHFIWDEKTFPIGVSIGVVLIDSNSGNISKLLNAADSACYLAKKGGRNRVQVTGERIMTWTSSMGICNG